MSPKFSIKGPAQFGFSKEGTVELVMKSECVGWKNEGKACQAEGMARAKAESV